MATERYTDNDGHIISSLPGEETQGMTVADLIEALSQYPSDARVMYYGAAGMTGATEEDVVYIELNTHTNTIWIT